MNLDDGRALQTSSAETNAPDHTGTNGVTQDAVN